MIMALLIAGIVFLLAGLLGIVLGIPVKEFSFGNTEILAGVITACTGMIMISLWVAIRELKQLMQRAEPAIVAPAARAPFALPASLGDPPPSNHGPDDGFPSVSPDHDELAPPSASPPPWFEETAMRDRGRSEPPVAPVAPKARRNLMFSSSSRKEREREREARPGEPIASADARQSPPIAPPLPKPADASPASFEDAWPQPDRGTTPDPVSWRGARTAPAAPVEDIPDAAQVSVLKSGVVDGMAYSLYSDGSIEAQMPEGMMRFASIDDLRTHLDQRA